MNSSLTDKEVYKLQVKIQAAAAKLGISSEGHTLYTLYSAVADRALYLEADLKEARGVILNLQNKLDIIANKLTDVLAKRIKSNG